MSVSDASKPLLIYAFVAKGTQILTEVTQFAGNFRSYSLECLRKVSGQTKYKCKFDFEYHTFSFLVENGYVYHVMADRSAGYQLPFIFLSKLRHSFEEKFLTDPEKGRLVAFQDFAPSMLELMRHCSENATEIKRQARVQQETLETLRVAARPEAPLVHPLTLQHEKHRQCPCYCWKFRCVRLSILCILIAASLAGLALLLAWLQGRLQ